MNLEEIFDTATNLYGGRLTNQPKHLKDYKDRCNTFINHYKKDKKLLKPFPKIILDFVNNGSFNAFASKYQEFHIIGIHESVRLILFDLFNRMLSHRDILNEIGDSNDEQNPDQSINNYYSDITSLAINGSNGDYEFVCPLNKTRRLYATHLTTIAMDFIFQHELSHIMYGHVDYLNDAFGIDTLPEFYSDLDKKILNLDLQTLEMDADCSAILRCSNWALTVVNKPSLVHIDFQPFYNDSYKALGDIYFAIFNTFKLFGDGNFKNIIPGKNSHPEPRIRQLMLMMTFDIITKKFNYDIDIKKLDNSLLNRFLQSEKAYELITKRKINKEVFEPKYFSKHPLPKALEENWKNVMRNKLSNYSFAPLAE